MSKFNLKLANSYPFIIIMIMINNNIYIIFIIKYYIILINLIKLNLNYK